MTSHVHIRPLAPTDSFDELTALLHAAYARLAALGFNYTAVDQSVDVTRSRAASGECYVATHADALVGTILFRRNPRGCGWYEQDHVAGVGQFAVLPAWQGKQIGHALMKLAEERAVACGATELAIDTSEGAAHLIAWYARRGYRVVDHAQWEGKTYRSVILSKPLTVPGLQPPPPGATVPA